MAEIRRSPVDMVNIPFTGFYTSQVVQDFFHQQYQSLQALNGTHNPTPQRHLQLVVNGWTLTAETWVAWITIPTPPHPTMSRKHHGHLKAVVQLVQYIIWASTWEFIYNYSILALNGSRVVLYSLNMINQTSFGHIVIENLPCSQELRDLCVSTLFLQCNAICAFDAYHSQNPYPKVHPGNYLILLFCGSAQNIFVWTVGTARRETVASQQQGTKFPLLLLQILHGLASSQQAPATKALNHIVDQTINSKWKHPKCMQKMSRKTRGNYKFHQIPWVCDGLML